MKECCSRLLAWSMCYFSITMLRQQSEGTPASLLVFDEGLLQQAAGLVNGSKATVSAAAHLLTHSPQVCHKCVQRPVQARHAQQGIFMRLTYSLQHC